MTYEQSRKFFSSSTSGVFIRGVLVTERQCYKLRVGHIFNPNQDSDVGSYFSVGDPLYLFRQTKMMFLWKVSLQTYFLAHQLIIGLGELPAIAISLFQCTDQMDPG